MIEAALLCLALNVYHEARGEPTEGQLAVAQVTMNRVHSMYWPDSVCEVVWQPYQFSWTNDGLSDVPTDTLAWARSKQIAQYTLNQSVYLKDVGNATHYHADYVSPKWAKHMAYKTTIGRHIFYYGR